MDDDRIEPAAPDGGGTVPAEAPVIGWDTGVQWEVVDPTPPMPPARVTLSIGSVLGRTLDLFLRRPLVFIAFALPGAILSMVGTGPADSSLVINGFPWLVFLLDLLLSIVSILATVIAADRLRATGSVGIVSVVRGALDRTPVAIGSSIVQYLAIIGVWLLGALILSGLLTADSALLAYLLVLVFVIATLYVLMRWSLANAAIALERIGPIAALGRSRALTAGNVRRISGLYLLLVALGLPLEVALYLLGFTGTDEGLRNILAVVGGLTAGPLLAIASGVLLGDLTGRPAMAAPHPAASRLRIAFVAVLVILGCVGIVIAFPKLGPAWERQGWDVPAADRGRLVAGTAHDPAHPCTPVGVSTTFSPADTIYLGGYFDFPEIPGTTISVDIYAGEALMSSSTLPGVAQSQSCFEGEPLAALRPGSYRVVVTQDRLPIAEGRFEVR